MRSIESKEDHLAVVAKYGARLKPAQTNNIDLKHELVALGRTLDAKPPASASEGKLLAYKALQRNVQYSLKLAANIVSESDDMFATAAKTVKMGKLEPP